MKKHEEIDAGSYSDAGKVFAGLVDGRNCTVLHSYVGDQVRSGQFGSRYHWRTGLLGS